MCLHVWPRSSIITYLILRAEGGAARTLSRRSKCYTKIYVALQFLGFQMLGSASWKFLDYSIILLCYFLTNSFGRQLNLCQDYLEYFRAVVLTSSEICEILENL